MRQATAATNFFKPNLLTTFKTRLTSNLAFKPTRFKTMFNALAGFGITWPRLTPLKGCINASTRKVGGLRFVKLGRFTLMFCISREYRPL
jgi:hypothetical protein